MSPRQQSELDLSTQEKIIDLFDNEAVWDADDTDGYIIQIFHDLEAAGASLVALKDQGWNTLLHVASLWNRTTIMEELVRKGASLNSKNKNGHTPLDLAMHWGHFDIGQQLRHYGGKHTCEQERDIAISQRDLAQQQLKNCELEHEHSVKSLKQAKQDREQLRIERDRLVVLRAQVVEDFRELNNQIEGYRSAAASLTKERDDWSIQAAQLQSELECEKAARNNAVQSWKVAEKIIADLQQIQEECREREEEALRLRNEAIQDRNVARERAKEAQLDQGIAKQNQLEVENQRDRAVERLLQGESEMAHDKEKWRKLIAKTELERRNIQIEIDRQTEILRCENAKLEKTVVSLTIANTRQKADLERSQLTIRTLEKQLDRHQQDLKSEAGRNLELKEQVEALLAERRLEYKAWRTQLELKMQQEFSDELKRILEGVIKTWKTLLTCQEKMNIVATAVEPRATSPSRTPAIMSSIFQTRRPHTSATGLGSPGFLPFIQEAPVGLKGSTSTSVLLESSESGIVSDPVFTDQENTIKNHWTQAEKALQELAMGTTSEQIIQLCAFVQNFIEEVTIFLSANFQRLRRRAQAQEKIIERKGELIQRFTHHREEKAKRQNPARFRECSVRPQR